MVEVLQTILLYFETLNRVAINKGGAIELPNSVTTYVQFFQCLQILQTVNAEYLIVICLENLEFLQITELQTVKVTDIVIGNVQYL